VIRELWILKGTNKVKSKLGFAAVVALMLSPPVAYAGDGYGKAVVSGVISGIISAAAQQRQQTVVVEKRVVVHDRTVVHERKAATHKDAKVEVRAAPTVAPAPVDPSSVTQPFDESLRPCASSRGNDLFAKSSIQIHLRTIRSRNSRIGHEKA
jgi:hypothetical protein